MAVALSLAACRAQVKAKANMNAAGTEAEDDRKWELPEPPLSHAPTPPARVAAAITPAPAAPSSVAFFGVMRDLSISPDAPRLEVCRCLAVIYGPPGDPKFAWQTGTPPAGDGALAIAIASEGVTCPSGAPPARTSVSGIEQNGNEIVLTVENAGEGRPIMRGVLVAAPGSNAVLVVRTKQGAPYPAATGGGPCRIALP
jgi:hypothetical protein